MKKSFISLLLLVALIVTIHSVSMAINTNYSPPTAAPQDLASAKNDDNNYLGFPYFRDQLPNGKKLRMEKYQNNEHILLYGTPNGDFEQGQYRFLGTNKTSENIPNINFPYDVAPEGKLDDQHWISMPWANKELKSYLNKKGEKILENQPFDGDVAFLKNIKTGLKLKQPTEYRGAPAVEWNKIVHILQPPTYYGWGVGRAWHKKADGSIWYRTIPIAPTKLVPPAPETPKPPKTDTQEPTTRDKENLKIYITGYSGDPWPGSTITVNAQAINYSGQYLITDLVWKLNGKVIKSVNNFDLIKTGNASVSFKMPSGNAKIEVSINPNKNRPQNETTWADNTGGTTLKPLQLPPVSGKDIRVKINAPIEVLGYTSTGAYNEWTYKVTVTYSWTRPKGYTGPPPEQKVTLTSTATGKIANWSNSTKTNINVQNVSKTYSKTFTIKGGQSIPYTHILGPGAYLINEDQYVVINARLSTGATDSAKVLVKGMPVTLVPVLTK